MEPRVIDALDSADAQSALSFCDGVDPKLCRLKIGKELFTAAGPRPVETLARRGFGIFLDLKFHDIPLVIGHPVTRSRDPRVVLERVNQEFDGVENMK